jgi:phage tail sheath protein FI
MTNYNHPGVYINELPLANLETNVGGTAQAAGAMIAQLPKGPSAITRVTSWYDFQGKFGGFNSQYPATFQAYLFFQNGGDSLYVRRVIDADAPRASVALYDTTPTTPVKICDIEAKSKGNDGLNLRVQFTESSLIQNGGEFFDITVTYESGAAYTNTSGTITGTSDDIVLEKFYGVTLKDESSSDFISNVLSYGSSYIRVKEVSGDDVKTTDVLTPVTSVLPLTGTLSTTPVVVGDYTGDTADTGEYANFTVLKEFDVLTQPLIMFAPDAVAKLGETDGKVVYNAMIDWAETGLGFVVVETNKEQSVSAALSWIDGLTASSRVAAYYPHFYVKDPLSRSGSAVRRVGPSGAVAGLYLATDKQAGPFKTPAGMSATVKKSVALERPFTSADLDALNTGTINGVYKGPINAIRNLPGAGIVVMGGRTLLQDGTANRFINMRRSLMYIEKSLTDLATFAVFENNTEELWSRIVTTLGTFLNDYRNQGGLRGGTAAEAFYVKCDAENNTNQSIADGFVNVEVGVALEYPAEFVVINLSQKTAE